MARQIDLKGYRKTGYGMDLFAFSLPPQRTHAVLILAMETSKLVKKVITADFLGGLFILYILQLVGYKVYRAFVYPYYVSPLRHLPGPKVTMPCKTCSSDVIFD